MLDERALLQFFEGCLQFFLGVHHDRSIPGNGFVQRLPADQQKAYPILCTADLHFLSAAKEHQRSIFSIGIDVSFLRFAKVSFACENVSESMLESFYGITERVQVVKDGEEISLGKHTVRFYATPWVHWPETMMTYEVNEKILFPCDGFGGFGALSGTIFDDPVVPQEWYEQEALRYFVNIVAAFCKPVNNAIAKLSTVPISIVAPSHDSNLSQGQIGISVSSFEDYPVLVNVNWLTISEP